MASKGGLLPAADHGLIAAPGAAHAAFECRQASRSCITLVPEHITSSPGHAMEPGWNMRSVGKTSRKARRVQHQDMLSLTVTVEMQQ
jgi:hypothetical protein